MKAPIVMQINMLGEFSISYGDETINEKNSRSHKLWTFLQYLITFREKKITQNELIELLWSDDSVEDPANTLKTLLHRARTMLSTLKVTDNPKKLIVYRQGIYSWEPNVPYVIDAEEFDRLCLEASSCEQKNEKLDMLLKAIELYKGDFLPNSSLDIWVIPLNAYYHSQYLKSVHEAVDMLYECGRYEEMISICQKAVSIDSYDEQLHLYLIKGLVATGAQRAALQHYDYVTDMFFTQFGVTPSPELTALYKEVVKTSKSLELDLNIIKEDLREEESKKSAFFCEYEFFKSIYRLEARAAARTGYVIHIALITVTDLSGEPLNQKQLNSVMEKLKNVIYTSLRRSDIFTRYSIAQYLIMLPAASFENSCMVMRRLTGRFKSLYPKVHVSLQYKLLPLDPLPV